MKKINSENLLLASLFISGGTFDNMNDFKKITIVVNGRLTDKSKHWEKSLHFRHVNNVLQVVYIRKNKIAGMVSKKVDFKVSEFTYRVLKTKLVLGDYSINDFLNKLDIFTQSFFSAIEKQWFNDVLQAEIKNDLKRREVQTSNY
jgi:hypothetical protein